MTNLQSILHASFIVSDLDASTNFYMQVLGLSINQDRPGLGYPGVWLDVGSQQVHLMQLPNPDSSEGRPEHGGRDRHVAFSIVDLNELCQRLDKLEISYTLSKSGRRAMFCRDPDGNALEFIEHPLAEHLPREERTVYEKAT